MDLAARAEQERQRRVLIHERGVDLRSEAQDIPRAVVCGCGARSLVRRRLGFEKLAASAAESASGWLEHAQPSSGALPVKGEA